MIRNMVTTIFLFCLVIPFGAPASAEVPSGHYENQFPNYVGLWDVTGTYSSGDSVSGSQITLVQDDKGKITGQTSLWMNDPALTINLYGTAKGSITTFRTGDTLNFGVPRINLALKLRGIASNGSVTVPVTMSVSFLLDISWNTELTGTYQTTVCVKARGGGCQTTSGPQDFSLPVDMDGTWDLVLDAQSGKQLTGTASVVLSNGRTLPLSLKGRYDAQTDMANVTLKGRAGTVLIEGNSGPGALMVRSLTIPRLLGQNYLQIIFSNP